jgi:hypothetical protein
VEKYCSLRQCGKILYFETVWKNVVVSDSMEKYCSFRQCGKIL